MIVLPAEVVPRDIAGVTVRLYGSREGFLELCAGDVEELVGLHVVGAGGVEVVGVEPLEVGLEDMQTVALLRR